MTYKTAINLPLAPPNKDGAAKAALNRAHELRKFEIENYWKRATYFWAFQLTATAAAGWGGSNERVLAIFFLLPCGLGAISGWAAYLSARGSKFWQANWESHVDALEEDCEGLLTQVILYKDRPAPSVSRVNEAFLTVLTLSWTAAFLFIALGGSGEDLSKIFEDKRAGLVAIIALLGAGLYILLRSRPNFRGVKTATRGSTLWTRLAKERAPGVMLIRDTLLGVAQAPTKPAESPPK